MRLREPMLHLRLPPTQNALGEQRLGQEALNGNVMTEAVDSVFP